jgi:putative ABC transport system ATP-binding protein
MHLLAQVDMAGQAAKLPSAVSGGQQQRVAIARALANDPPLIVADEPTGNLDSKTADAVFALFESLVAAGKTIIMVTHDNDLAQRGTRAVVVADGAIVEQTINRRPGGPAVVAATLPPLPAPSLAIGGTMPGAGVTLPRLEGVHV